MTTLHPAHPYSPLTVADLENGMQAYLPPSGQALVNAVGAEAALLLLSKYPGVLIPNVPKTPNGNPHGARRWAALSELIGETAMCRLADTYGGVCLSVPTCKELRIERRNRAVIAEFDRLSAAYRVSKNKAVEALCLMFAPITYRQIELILDTPTNPTPVQPSLFEG